jgi:2,3-bisphosphoglycerate-independent phosphoglycerate mutase
LKVLLLFIDGMGIGKKDYNYNPFFFTKLETFSKILNGNIPHFRNRRVDTKYATLIPADTRFGIKGLPQSGTGQTAIFCGINAPKIIGKHFGPYPYSDLKPYIKNLNLFQRLKEKKKKVHFANAYPKQFFEYIASGKTRFTVTTFACMISGIPLQKHEEMMEGKAISADITAEGWKKLGYDIKPINPILTGKRLYSIALKNDFTLFEYFLTDHAGHSRKKDFASEVLIKYDRFLNGILDKHDPNKLFIIIVSDHGNIEDLSVKTHTLNPVPVILIGKNKDQYAKKIRSIKDIYYIITEILTE